MSRYRFDRRTFISGLGIGGGLIPMLPSRSHGATAASPRRLVVISVPNGYTPDYLPEVVAGGWRARNTEFSPLKVLEPHKERLLILGGINIQNGIDTAREVKKDPGASIGGHAILPFILTGAKGMSGPSIPDGWRLTASHPSIDQFVVQNVPEIKQRPFSSLVLRPVRMNAGGYGNNPLSYTGKSLDGNSHNAPTIRENPVTLFNDLFGGKVDTSAMDKIRAQKKSILDFTSGQLKQLQARVGKEDRLRLQNHLDGVAQLEKQIATVSTGCSKPTAPTAAIWTDQEFNAKMDLVLRTHIDMSVAAMACDLTRVCSHLWVSSNNNTIVFPWLASQIPSLNDNWAGNETAGSGNNLRNHHTIAHNEGALKREKNLVDRFFLENFAYFIERLSTTMDMDGRPMIDNTILLFTNMQRTGGGHQVDNLQWFLAGNVNGYFKQGRYLPWLSGTPNRTAPTNGVFTAIANAMGCPPADSFADPVYGGEATVLKA